MWGEQTFQTSFFFSWRLILGVSVHGKVFQIGAIVLAIIRERRGAAGGGGRGRGVGEVAATYCLFVGKKLLKIKIIILNFFGESKCVKK